MGFPGYTGWTVTLDPPAVALAGRVALDINSPASGIQIGGTSSGQGIDWGTADIQAYEASQGRFGSGVVDFEYPNRTVTIPLGLGMSPIGPDADTALASLRAKVALIQRESGTLLRQRLGGPAMYADIEKASLQVPDVWGETAGVEAGATLVLECRPDFYGDEIVLDTLHCTGVCDRQLTLSSVAAAIGGDYPARCRIIVTDTSGHDQQGALWASRRDDAASTARTFYEAEALTPLDAAVIASQSGASGGQVVRHASLTGGSWCPVLATDHAIHGPLTHQGSFRVWARCYSPAAVPQLRLMWATADITHAQPNDAVRLPAAAGYYLIDLGAVSLEAPPSGTFQWRGVLQALADNDGDEIDVDCVYLQPLGATAGTLAAVQPDSPPLGVGTTLSPTVAVNDAALGTVAWTTPTFVFHRDTDSATALGSATRTNYLKASGFDFHIPSSATISGIEVRIRRQQAGVSVTDSHIRLVKAGVVQAGERADTATPWPQYMQYRPYGGESDLWTNTWAPADVNAAGFGVAISALFATALEVALIDHVQITVYYVTSGAFTPAADAVMYASSLLEIRSEGTWRENAGTSTVTGAVADERGDLARLPTSGLEQAPIAVFVKPSRGDLDTLADSGLDTFDVQVRYRPCYLLRP